jgi:hypothetical protein
MPNNNPNDPSYYCGGNANIAGNANLQGNVKFADPLSYSSLARLRQRCEAFSLSDHPIPWTDSNDFCAMYAQAQLVMDTIMDQIVDPPIDLSGN